MQSTDRESLPSLKTALNYLVAYRATLKPHSILPPQVNFQRFERALPILLPYAVVGKLKEKYFYFGTIKDTDILRSALKIRSHGIIIFVISKKCTDYAHAILGLLG